MAGAQTAQRAGNGQGQAASLPFNIASRRMSRFSFTTGTLPMQAAAPTPVSMIQIPAVGYLSHLNLEVTVATTGAAAGTGFNADGPFNAIALAELKTAAGNDIIVPVTGYQLYILNKYGCQFAGAPWSDAKASPQYQAITGVAAAAHFFMPIPLEIDAHSGFGAIPALASNRSYQLQLTLAAIGTVFSGAVPATATVTVNGTAWYWSEPPASTQNGVTQATEPNGLGSLSQWQVEQPPLTPGDKLIKSNNTGNVLRTLVFTLRNAAGARIDTNGWPAVSEFYVDNEPMFYLTQNEWSDMMVKWYGFDAAAKDTVKGLDTGVYVLPFFALPSNDQACDSIPRNQYLPTLDASQVQLRGTAWGSAVSTLEIMTNSVIPTSAGALLAG